MSKVNKYYLPSKNANDENAEITSLCFEAGSKVKKGDIIYTFETTKAVVEFESDHNGYIQYFVQEGDQVDVGSIVCAISDVKKNILNKKNSYLSKKENKAKPTKKALVLASKHDLDINSLGLEGIIKEKDLIPFIVEKDNAVSKAADKCLILNKKNRFINYLLNDESFKNLSSKEKIKKYKENGHKIGNNVKFHKGTILIGNIIQIDDNVSIGDGTYIESAEINIGANSSIGKDCEIVASKLIIGKFNKISNKVIIDISGGRFPDSNLITGIGCLIASQVYINVCRQVILEENVALSPRSIIYTHSYWQSLLDGYTTSFGPVSINKDAWLGSASQILPNINIGQGSIIISNSLVSSNVDPYTMVGGVPATIIKKDLKKNITKINKQKIIEKLFFELRKWLYSHHFEIKNINDREINIFNDKENKNCLLLSEKSKLELVKSDIIIAYNSNGLNPKNYKTLFDIKNKTIIGPVQKIEKMIVDFFRRQGIRFYGK